MDNTVQLTPEQNSSLQFVLSLAHNCDVDPSHTHQVTRFSLTLFDSLSSYHNLGLNERFYLQCASLLHDIGWVEGWKGHHKQTLKIILTTTLLTFDNRERLIVGSIARYHRKALPNLRHDHFAALSEQDRKVVLPLAAILRMADGLDSSHSYLVRDLQVDVTDLKILIKVFSKTVPTDEILTCNRKKELLELAFHREVKILWKRIK